jgi:hypothetical protein
MKRGGGVHTVPATDALGWWNELDGRICSKHKLKVEAVATGRAMARSLKVGHTIHNQDGQIAEKNSYGQDSFPPRG